MIPFIIVLVSLFSCDARAHAAFEKWERSDGRFQMHFAAAELRRSASAASMSASPARVANEGVTWITVQWTDVETPRDTDMVVFYSPEDTFLGYRLANASQTWSLGHGSLVFGLYNLRENYTFKYVAGFDPDAPPTSVVEIARSNVVEVDAWYPKQLQLGFGVELSDAGEQYIHVRWLSGSFSTPTVKYRPLSNTTGGEPGSWQIATGSSRTYTRDDLKKCQADSRAQTFWRSPGNIHVVPVGALKPGVTYEYVVGSDDGFIEQARFFRAPVPQASSMRAIVLGDIGVGKCGPAFGYVGFCEAGANQTYKAMRRYFFESERAQDDAEYARSLVASNHALLANADFLLITGDLAYARGWENRWDSFDLDLETLVSYVPGLFGIGNHEYDWQGQPFAPKWGNYFNDSNGECGVPYVHRYQSPYLKDEPVPARQSLWYSLNVGPVHMIVMSGEHDFLPGSAQHEWLKSDVSRIDHARTPFTVLTIHRPLYSSGNASSDYRISLHLRAALEPVIVGRVDLVLGHHYHQAEYTTPVMDGRAARTAAERALWPVHVVVGAGGCCIEPDFMDPQPEWSVFREGTAFGYGVMTANRTSLQLTFFENENAEGQSEALFDVSIPVKQKKRRFIGANSLSFA